MEAMGICNFCISDLGKLPHLAGLCCCDGGEYLEGAGGKVVLDVGINGVSGGKVTK